MPMVLTGQQLEVLEALRGKETEEYPLSNWYLGALYALDNHYNPDRISQAAQSLRELIEKLPRAVREMDDQGKLYDFKGIRRTLYTSFSKDKSRYQGEWRGKEIDADLDKTLRKIDDYLEWNQQPTRREQMQTAIAAFDPMAGQFDSNIRQAKRDALHKLWRNLEGFAHHRRDADIAEFQQCLGTLERVVFDLLAPITAQDQDEIQSILKRSDRSADAVERMLSLIKRRGANFVFFFTHATDASWIPILKKRGYFAELPKAETIEDGRVTFPFWRPIFYLERVSVTAPCLVVDTILNFQDTDNPRILHTIAEIALKVEPIEQSLRLEDWVSKYLQSLYHFGASDLIPKLLNRWAGASTKATDAALNLMRTAVSFKVDPESQEKQARRSANSEDWTTILESQPRFDQWQYEQILEKGVRPLAERVSFHTARILINATAFMIRLQLHQDELERAGGNDYSTIWCPRVNEPGNGYRDSQRYLVDALTFACEKVYEKAPESVAVLDQALRNRRWDIFMRIRQHLYALHPNEETKPWIREMILGYQDYSKWEHPFEFQRMIRLACEKLGADLLTTDEKERIFETILSGPSKQDFRDRTRDRFTEELFERRKRYFHRLQLSPFAPVLFGRYADYFQELKEEEEKPIKDGDYAPFEAKAGTVKERSPKGINELEKMSDEELLSFLNEWKNVQRYFDENTLVEIDFRGLARAFQSNFKEVILSDESRLRFWMENRERVERPLYVRAMVSAIHEQVESKQFDKLDQWFDLCEWVLSHPDLPKEEGVNRGDVSKEHPDWGSSRRAVGDFIEMCLKKDVNVPITAREHLASLLDKLCTQYDRQLDDDEPVLLNRDDQLTEAINNTRSRALKDLVDFGHWVRRQRADDQADTPEVFAILEKRLGSECEHPLKLPEYALLGMHYVRILDLDREWAARHKSDFFPQKNLRAWAEAFGNFLKNSQPYRPIFDVFRDDIEFALKNIEKLEVGTGERVNLTDTLGEHLFAYYLWDVYPLTGGDSLLERFYEKTRADKERWSRLFNNIGFSLRNSGKQLQEGLEQRVVEFFEWRYEQQVQSELEEFPIWLSAECLDAEWRLKSYSRILDICGSKEFIVSIQVDVLREMLEGHTALVVACFAKLTDVIAKNRTVFIQSDKAKPIIRAGLGSDDATVQANAERALENLLQCGHFSLLDEED